MVYDYSRVFLLEDHLYRRVVSSLNGKPKRTQRPEIITPIDWIREYEIKKEKEILELFDSNGEPLSNDPKFFDTYVEKMEIRMKRKYIFYKLLYW